MSNTEKKISWKRNLACIWTGPFVFDSTELPIITIYLMYLPMIIQWMRKEKDQTMMKRFVLPILSLCGSVFMVVACIFSHKIGCLWYMIVFAVMPFNLVKGIICSVLNLLLYKRLSKILHI